MSFWGCEFVIFFFGLDILFVVKNVVGDSEDYVNYDV